MAKLNILSTLKTRMQERWLWSVLLLVINVFSIYFINFDIQNNLEQGKELYILFSAVGHLFGVLFWITIIQLLLLPLNNKVARILYWFLFATALFVAVFEVFVIFKYKSPITDSIVASILGTNNDEALEFFTNLENIKYITQGLFALVGLTLLTRYVGKYIHDKLPRLNTILAILVWSICALSSGWYVYKYFPYQKGQYATGGAFYWGMSGIERLHYATLIYMRDAEALRNNIDLMKDIKLDNLSPTREFQDLNLIIIMGESLRRNSMHLYGADMPNTPSLDSLVVSENLVVFTDAACSGTNTSLAVPFALTFYQVDKHAGKEWTKYPTILKAISQSGFSTYWLSNQENRGAFANPISSIAHTADSVVYTKDRSSLDYYDEAFNGDELVLPHLRKAKEENLFSVIHLMGSHEKYERRYPKTFDIFEAKENGEKSKIVAHYHNSIIYNDYIVSRIMKHYQDDNAIIIYLSDHGIEMYDNPENDDHQGHASSPYIAPVPFMVYMTDKAKELYPDIYTALHQSANHPFSTDGLSTALVDLLGIQTEYADNKSCFFRASYTAPSSRMLKSFERIISLDSLIRTPDKHAQYIKQQ